MSSAGHGGWDLGRLAIFMAVAKTGTLKAAASTLGIPQPAISRQIARLESECQGRLFGRTGRGMTLTDLGVRLLPQIERLLNDADVLTHEVAATGGTPFGEVCIGVLPSLYLTLMYPLFFHTRKHLPGIKLQIVEGSAGQIEQWLLSGHVDIGVLYRYGKGSEPDGEILLATDSLLVGPPGDKLTSGSTVPFSRLDNLPLVLPSAPSTVRFLLSQLAQRAGITLNVVLEADSGQLQKHLPSLGVAYTISTHIAIDADLKAGKLQAARIIDPVIERHIVLATTAARPLSFAARAVTNAIRQIDLSPTPGGP